MSPRENLHQIAADRGESLANLSALIGRNAAHLHQFVGRGSPACATTACTGSIYGVTAGAGSA